MTNDPQEQVARPIGRRPGDAQDTRDDILAAARQRFAVHGYERATIRAIAADADVDPALVIHHFSNKEQLFTAAHDLGFDPKAILRDVGDLPLEERARAVARIYLTTAASPNSPALSMLRGAATNAHAAQLLNEFITSAFLANADVLMPGPDAERRVALVGAHLVGVIVGRHIVELAPLAESSIDELVELIAPALDAYFIPEPE